MVAQEITDRPVFTLGLYRFAAFGQAGDRGILRVLFSVFCVLGYDRFDTFMRCREENV